MLEYEPSPCNWSGLSQTSDSPQTGFSTLTFWQGSDCLWSETTQAAYAVMIPKGEIVPHASLADPGFGQGEAKNFFVRYCRCSKTKQSEQYNITI